MLVNAHPADLTGEDADGAGGADAVAEVAGVNKGCKCYNILGLGTASGQLCQ